MFPAFSIPDGILVCIPSLIYDHHRLKPTFFGSGIPMNDTSKPRLQIAEAAEAILGDYLIGFQLGNEPNLYAAYVSSLLSSP